MALTVGYGGIVIAAADPVAIPSKNVKVRRSVEPVDLRRGPQLFIDEYLIAEFANLKRVTHAPTRFSDGPVLGHQQHTTQPYVTVLRDPDTLRFRMWYNYDIGEEACIAYAESADGMHWETPSLGILGPDNRLLKITTPYQNGYGVSVIDEGSNIADSARRYKMAWWGQSKPVKDGPCGMRVAFSKDGLHWTIEPGDPVLPDYNPSDALRPFGAGDIIDVFFDPLRQRYGALVKTPAVPADGLAPGPRASSYIRRMVSASFSEDFVKWERPWRSIRPEPVDEGLLEFYSSGGTIARGPLLISFLRMLHDDYSAEPGGPANGIGYATLITSRDGEHWERHHDTFFDRNPTPGAWDRAMTWIGSVLPVGDELFIYYGGYKRGHKVEPKTERQIGLAKMPLDRFVSRGAMGDTPGRLLTVPLRVRAGIGSHFTLNADAAAGQIRVQILDVNGRPIPGYSFDDTVPVKENGLKLRVKWFSSSNKRDLDQDHVDLARLDDQTVRLEFEITNARLFGFDLMPGQEMPLRLGDGPHLFVDDYLVAEQKYLARVVQQPTKLNRPMLPPELQPTGKAVPGSLVFDEQRKIFRIWYWTPTPEVRSQLMYTESPDPRNWSQPAKPVAHYDGFGFSVLDEGPNTDDVQRRFKLMYFEIGKPPMGPRALFSPDGQNWTPYAGHPLLPTYPHHTPLWHLGVGDILDPYWDPIRRRYGMLVKMMSAGDAEFGMNSRSAGKGLGIRLTSATASDDFLHWENPWRAYELDYRDDGVFEFYGGRVIARGDLLIAFIRILRDDLGEEGQGYTVLAVSRDGRTWERVREPFLNHDPNPDSIDHAFAWVTAPAQAADTVYLAYGAYNRGHKTGNRQAGLAWLKRDRYVSREPRGDRDACLLTPLLECKSGVPDGLWLNVDASKGQVTVRVLDEDGKPLPGFESSQPIGWVPPTTASEIHSTELNEPVKWSEPLSKIGHRPFRLEFTLHRAALYGFSFKPL